MRPVYEPTIPSEQRGSKMRRDCYARDTNASINVGDTFPVSTAVRSVVTDCHGTSSNAKSVGCEFAMLVEETDCRELADMWRGVQVRNNVTIQEMGFERVKQEMEVWQENAKDMIGLRLKHPFCKVLSQLHVNRTKHVPHSLEVLRQKTIFVE